MPTGDILGDKLYQKSASKTLPLLVRQADLRTPIVYSDVAAEVGMGNPRNLNHVLDCVGLALVQLSKQWKEKIPPIQCLVVNKNTRLPSEGVGWFIKKKNRKKFDSLPLKERRRLVQIEFNEIYAYGRWPAVLTALGLAPVTFDYTKVIAKAALLGPTQESKAGSFGAGGESDAHKRLKYFVAEHPEVVRLLANRCAVSKEELLPSGDKVDVFFRRGQDCIAVEVKSAVSTVADITRGLFQCVKYRAVIEAEQGSKGLPQSGSAVLVLESKLPPELLALKNSLGIEVIDEIIPTPRGWKTGTAR